LESSIGKTIGNTLPILVLQSFPREITFIDIRKLWRDITELTSESTSVGVISTTEWLLSKRQTTGGEKYFWTP